jgi:hypothetical protein
MHLGPEGVRLILCQVYMASGPELLWLRFQFQKMPQGGNQHRLGTPANLVSGRGIDSALEQLHRCGQ